MSDPQELTALPPCTQIRGQDLHRASSSGPCDPAEDSGGDHPAGGSAMSSSGGTAVPAADKGTRGYVTATLLSRGSCERVHEIHRPRAVS